jgi:hypothetical protein
METIRIQELVFSFLDSIGVKRTLDERGFWVAAIPAAEQNFFNGYAEYRFTFEREVAEKHREIEMISEGSYLLKKIIERLAAIPKVSRLYSNAHPELPPQGPTPNLVLLTPGKAHYRQKIVFTFKVSFVCDHRMDRLYSAVADTADGEIHMQEGSPIIPLQEFSETPDPAISMVESDEDLLRLYLQTCRKIEDTLTPGIEGIRSEYEGRFLSELKKVETYLNEQKRELQQKKENVCFHLYFFQKEEEIEKMIRDLESEHTRKVEELKDKYKVKVEILLLNAVVLCIPTYGVSAQQLSRKKRESQGIIIPDGRKEGSALSIL